MEDKAQVNDEMDGQDKDTHPHLSVEEWKECPKCRQWVNLGIGRWSSTDYKMKAD